MISSFWLCSSNLSKTSSIRGASWKDTRRATLQSCSKKTAEVSRNMRIALSKKCHEHSVSFLYSDKHAKVFRKK